jgi:hypothetical protein
MKRMPQDLSHDISIQLHLYVMSTAFRKVFEAPLSSKEYRIQFLLLSYLFNRRCSAVLEIRKASKNRSLQQIFQNTVY